MLVRVVSLLVTVIGVSLGCSSENRKDQPTPKGSGTSQNTSGNATSKPHSEDVGVGVAIDVQDGQHEEIQDRNDAILARLREEELGRKSVPISTEVVAPEGAGASHTPTVASDPLPPADKTPETAPRSSMEELRERATEFEPHMEQIARTADRLDDNYRRYMDACYQKYTTAERSGSISGNASAYSQGTAAGRDWFAVYESRTNLTYQGRYDESTAISNETTAFCRELWSDIVAGSREVNQNMKALQQDARRKGVLPGHLRDLRRKYRLDWEGWTR